MRKNKLGNPATAIVTAKALDKTTEVIPFVLKTLFILGMAGFIIYKIKNKFRPLSENNAYPNANVTHGTAKTKADAIFSAMTGFGANVDLVANNIAGLNYNGFVRVFNAFGDKQGAIPFSDKMNMVEWFYDQFNEAELTKLRFLVPNIF